MQQTKRYQITKRVSLISGLTNALLAIMKLIIGSIGQSAALVADGLHSFSDLLSDGLVIIAAKAGSRGPDTDHPYGHRRIETLATIVIALLLLIIGGGIIVEMGLRLLHHETLPHPSLSVLLAALISIITNELLYRYNLSAGNKIQSKLLIANAWHNRSDAFSSLITLLTAGGAFFGVRFLDPIGAIIIAAFILRMGIKMIYESVNELIDTAADPTTVKQLQATINECEDVVSAHQIRTRMHGNNILVDGHILVSPTISVSEGHFIGDNVKNILMQSHSAVSDVTVHIDSEDDNDEQKSFHLPHRSQIIALLQQHCRHLPGIDSILELNLHYLNERISIEIVLPLGFSKTHDPITLQNDYQQAMKSVDAVDSIKLLFMP